MASTTGSKSGSNSFSVSRRAEQGTKLKAMYAMMLTWAAMLSTDVFRGLAAQLRRSKGPRKWRSPWDADVEPDSRPERPEHPDGGFKRSEHFHTFPLESIRIHKIEVSWSLLKFHELQVSDKCMMTPSAANPSPRISSLPRERSAIIEFRAGSTPAAKATSMTFCRKRMAWSERKQNQFKQHENEDFELWINHAGEIACLT